DLDTLWERQDWKALEEACTAIMNPGLMTRMRTGLSAEQLKRTPALLMLGVARYEQGDRKAGNEMIREYYDRYEDGFTVQFAAYGRYYLGLEARKQGSEAEAQELFKEAYANYGAERIGREIAPEPEIEEVQEVEGVTEDDGIPVLETVEPDRRFPLMYVLPRE